MLNKKAQLVKNILFQKYDKRLAHYVFGTWFMLEVMGESSAMETMSRTTFYTHCRLLVQAGVTWSDRKVRLYSLEKDNSVSSLPF